MTEAHAREIAALINERNELARTYTAGDIIREASNYEYEVRDGKVVACVERQKVQWYQWEICHLSVPTEWEGKGVAFAVYQRAEAAARSGGGCVFQCTIREGNKRSEKFFSTAGLPQGWGVPVSADRQHSRCVAEGVVFTCQGGRLTKRCSGRASSRPPLNAKSPACWRAAAKGDCPGNHQRRCSHR